MNRIKVRHGCFDDNGSVFKIVGANNYYLAFASDAMRRAVIAAAKEIGLNVLRAPAFLDCGSAVPGTVPEGAWRGVYFQYWNRDINWPEVNTGENGLERLDRLIADAEHAGIRLILPLVNYWPDFGGMDCYIAWFNQAGFTGHSREVFYRNPAIRDAYRSYAREVLTRTNTITGRRYTEEPAVLAWELANEPRCESSSGAAILLGWVREMSGWIKSHDPNHLLAIGDEGYLTKPLLEVPEIDFGTFHLYPEAWKKRNPIRFGLRWIRQHLEAGKQAGKPMLLEEYGMTSGSRRNAIYEEWLKAILEQDGAGDLAWMLASTDDTTGEPYRNHDQFTFYCADDVPSIRAHALEMAAARDRIPAWPNDAA